MPRRALTVETTILAAEGPLWRWRDKVLLLIWSLLVLIGLVAYNVECQVRDLFGRECQ